MGCCNNYNEEDLDQDRVNSLIDAAHEVARVLGCGTLDVLENGLVLLGAALDLTTQVISI